MDPASPETRGAGQASSRLPCFHSARGTRGRHVPAEDYYDRREQLWSRDQGAACTLDSKRFATPMKARVTKSGGKTMLIMFADIRGMILMHAVPKGATVNAGYYSKVIEIKGFVYFPSILFWINKIMFCDCVWYKRSIL